MKALRPVAFAALLSIVSGPAFSAGLCFTPTEAKAHQVRQVHTALMVASLRCDAAWGMRDRYNTYAKKSGSLMAANAKTLQDAFGRAYGKDRQNQFDRYITRLANDASISSPSTQEYCQSHLDLLDKLLAGEDIATLSVTGLDQGVACSETKKASAETKKADKAKVAQVSTKEKAKPAKAEEKKTEKKG